jgi:hypothetical protein
MFETTLLIAVVIILAPGRCARTIRIMLALAVLIGALLQGAPNP